MFYESLIILNISTLNFSEGVPASVLSIPLSSINCPHYSIRTISKAPTLANHNLTKVDSHVGHFKKNCWKPVQKPPETKTKADKSRCITLCFQVGGR